jgi:hypothetical protein
LAALPVSFAAQSDRSSESAAGTLEGTPMPQRTTVFVSYCHRNKRWLDRLKVHLKPYDRRGDLDLWDDTKIDPGDRWHAAISDAIDRAAASVVLISADFLASDFVAIHELPKLLLKAERAGARILPIFVEPCELTNHPELAAFQALNSPTKPLAETSRVEAERVLVRAVEVIGKLLASKSGGPPTPRTGAPPAAVDSAGNIFEELQSASIALSALWVLAKANGHHTLSELEDALDIRSRKRAYEALNKLSMNGWIEKGRVAGLTKYRLTEEGARQLQRLAAASDGPVRRAIAIR